MSNFLYAYKSASESAKALALGLNIKRIAHRNSKFVGDASHTVINWGASKLPAEVSKCCVLNRPEFVAIAANKLATFECGDIYDLCPPWTTNIGVARDWVGGGNTVVERHVLNGNSGDGIRIVSDSDDVEEAPLYVMYIPKKQEYRVHVFNDEVVDVQRKARRHDVEDDKINWQIRNFDNGFVFARNEDLGDVPVRVLDYAKHAVRELNLFFGAVDIIYNDRRKRPYVLEVNTAPGLSGTTLEGYVRRFSEYLGVPVVPPQPWA